MTGSEPQRCHQRKAKHPQSATSVPHKPHGVTAQFTEHGVTAQFTEQGHGRQRKQTTRTDSERVALIPRTATSTLTIAVSPRAHASYSGVMPPCKHIHRHFTQMSTDKRKRIILYD